MNIPFWKMHGAGNDFILIDNIQHAIVPTPQEIAAWCRRRTGIGAEGLILIQPHRTNGQFRMQFFNPDGFEAEMCGNGARCAARLAYDLSIAPPSMIIETAAGSLHATVSPDGGNVRLELPPPKELRLQQSLVLHDQQLFLYDFVNTGVPHVIIESDDLNKVPLNILGPAIRRHTAFAPRGTNVNFISVVQPNTLRIRTYERGVEDETLACGTGMAAAAVTSVLRQRVSSSVTVIPASGDRIRVDVTIRNGTPENLAITGPAVYTFTGNLTQFNPKELSK